MNLLIEDLGEPELEFGNGERDKDPKRILPVAGPFGSSQDIEPRTIQLGLVGLPDEINPVRQWIRRMHGPLISQETNALRFREFPGVRSAFRCAFEVQDRFVRRINQRQYDLNSTRRPNDRFSEMLSLYTDSISTLFGDQHPDCVLVCFPEELAALRVSNPRLTYHEQRFWRNCNMKRIRDKACFSNRRPKRNERLLNSFPKQRNYYFGTFIVLSKRHV
jgi:hypothetical protein